MIWGAGKTPEQWCGYGSARTDPVAPSVSGPDHRPLCVPSSSFPPPSPACCLHFSSLPPIPRVQPSLISAVVVISMRAFPASQAKRGRRIPGAECSSRLLCPYTVQNRTSRNHAVRQKHTPQMQYLALLYRSVHSVPVGYGQRSSLGLSFRRSACVLQVHPAYRSSLF